MAMHVQRDVLSLMWMGRDDVVPFGVVVVVCMISISKTHPIDLE